MVLPILQMRKQFQRGYLTHPESDTDSQDVDGWKRCLKLKGGSPHCHLTGRETETQDHVTWQQPW